MLGLDLVADRLVRGSPVERALWRDVLAGAAEYARRRDLVRAYDLATLLNGGTVDA